VSWDQRKAAKLYEDQGERWAQHHARKSREGITIIFRELDIEFACTNSDRREEILRELDAEVRGETAILPQSLPVPLPRPITQADVDAVAQTLKSRTMHAA
jgi:hypothetical protein